MLFSNPSTPHVSCFTNISSPPLQSSFKPTYLHCSWHVVRTAVCLGGVWGWACSHFLWWPPLLTPRHRQSSVPTSDIVDLLTALLYLSVLGVGRSGWIPLAPACTPDLFYQLSTLSLTTVSVPTDRLTGLSWVLALTYTSPTIPLPTVCSSPTELTRGMKGARLLSRQGLYHCCHCRRRVLHRLSLKLLQIKPYVALLATVEPRQGPEEAILFDRTSHEEIVKFLLSWLGTQFPHHRCRE